MKTVKTIVIVFVLGMFGYVYADQAQQTTTQKAESAATHCKMGAKDASCCVTGAACCKEGASCCNSETCCKEGAACCKEGEECCGSGECCKEGSSGSAAATSDSKHKGHDAKATGACCKAKDDSGSGCSASGCCAKKAAKTAKK